MEIYSFKPFLTIVASLLGAILIVTARKKPNLREGFSIGAGVIQLVIILSMITAVLDGAVFHFTPPLCGSSPPSTQSVICGFTGNKTRLVSTPVWLSP
jgi:hypothetical protein